MVCIAEYFLNFSFKKMVWPCGEGEATQTNTCYMVKLRGKYHDEDK